MTHTRPIDWRRFQESRELSGEWRILKAKIKHVVDRACRLAKKAATDDRAEEAIETLRVFTLDYIDGKPFRMSPFDMMRAFARVAELETADLYAFARAA